MKDLYIEQMTRAEFEVMLQSAVIEANRVLIEKEFEKMTYNIKETAKKIKRSENFIRKLVNQEILKTTADGKFITGKEINKYLGNEITKNKI